MADHFYDECRYAECHYAKCRVLFIIMLNVLMLCVVAPCTHPQKYICNYIKILIAELYINTIQFPVQTILQWTFAKLFCTANRLQIFLTLVHFMFI
jgi:hypothetical protein